MRGVKNRQTERVENFSLISKTMKTFLITILFVLSMTAVCSGSILLKLDLEGMTRASSHIVVARVTKVTHAEGKEPYGLAVATLAIEQLIVGSATDETCVGYVPKLSTSADFDVGERYLLFLDRRTDGLFSVVKGYAGSLPIKGNEVYVGHITGEKKTQLLNELIPRIQEMDRRALKK